MSKKFNDTYTRLLKEHSTLNEESPGDVVAKGLGHLWNWGKAKFQLKKFIEAVRGKVEQISRDYKAQLDRARQAMRAANIRVGPHTIPDLTYLPTRDRAIIRQQVTQLADKIQKWQKIIEPYSGKEWDKWKAELDILAGDLSYAKEGNFKAAYNTSTLSPAPVVPATAPVRAPVSPVSP